MSVIRKKPFIETVIDTLSLDLRNALKSVLDNNPETINRNSSFADMPSKNTVTAVYFKLDEMNYKNGILIYNNSYCVLVAYHRFQDLLIYDLDVAKKQYRKVNEYLDINEFRRVLNDKESSSISAGEIDSGEAVKNAMLVADGEGSADFVSPEEGSAQYLLGLDSEGNIVKDELPEGIVVDQTIVEDSENAVSGGAVYDALAEKADASDVYDKNAIDEMMETKANVDGNYPTMTVGAADNLTPYDESAGVDQEQPFLLQGTGCGNGEQQVDTGALALLKEKQGHSVVVNQFVNETDYSTTYFGMTLARNGQHVTISGTSNYPGSGDTNYYLSSTPNVIQGHKYLCISTSSNFFLNVYTQGGVAALKNYEIFTPNASGQSAMAVKPLDNSYISSGATLNEDFYIYLIDLTQWFGSNDNIPAHLLAHPEDFFRYYQGSLAYNEGELVNSNGRYLKTIGRNQWDEKWELDGSNVVSKNAIKVIPNTDYYFRVTSGEGVWFTVTEYDKDNNALDTNSIVNNHRKMLPNTDHIKFTMSSDYGTTYNNDITISLYYEGESGYDQYYPYEELANIDTGTETLRSAGSVKDSKAPDGTITRRIGYVDLGTLEWHLSREGLFYSYYTRTAAKEGSSSLCAALPSTGNGDRIYIGYENVLYCFYASAGSDVTAFKTAMSGVMLYYELAEPTTEQGTTFSENVAIDDFGSMDFGGTNGVPQGASIFYAVDYKAFIDSLYNTLDGDATDIVKESELDSKLATLGYVKLTSVSGYDATKTQVLKNVEGTLTWVTEE